MIYMCVIMKTMCPPGYHHNAFAATHAPCTWAHEPYIICPSA